MGKGRIISNLGEGYYRIEVVDDRNRAEQKRSESTDKIAELEDKIQLLEQDYDSLQIAVDAAIADQDTGLVQYQQQMAATGKSDIDIVGLAAQVLQAVQSRDVIGSQISQLQAQIASIQTTINLIDALPVSQQVNAWCADYSLDLSGSVATAEIPGEIGNVLVMPGGNGSTGIIQPVLSSTLAGTFLNLAMLPGWQKYRPTFRFARITVLYEGANLCDINLHVANSSQQNLSVNLHQSYASVPIEYMDCGDQAFTVGDDVLVQFVDQDPDQPKVIGFADHPKYCNESTDMLLYYPGANEWRFNGRVVTSHLTRPLNAHASGLGNITMWRNGAMEPDESRAAPASFANAGAIASHRYFDDANRGWWIIITKSSTTITIWLHQPAAEGSGDKVLSTLSIPSYISDGRVVVSATPRGDKFVLQVITDACDFPADEFDGAAPERYSVPWAQFAQVITLSGTGGWPGVEGEQWGVGINANVSAYSSLYSNGDGSLAVSRGFHKVDWGDFSIIDGPWTMQDGEIVSTIDPNGDAPYQGAHAKKTGAPQLLSAVPGTGSTIFSLNRVEQISAPALVFVDTAGSIHEFSVELTYNDDVSPYVLGHDNQTYWADTGEGVWSLYDPIDNIGDYSYDEGATRTAIFDFKLLFNGVEQIASGFTATNDNQEATLNGVVVNAFETINKEYVPFVELRADRSTITVMYSWHRALPNKHSRTSNTGYYADTINPGHVYGYSLSGDDRKDANLPDNILAIACDEFGRQYLEVPTGWNPPYSYADYRENEISLYIAHYMSPKTVSDTAGAGVMQVGFERQFAENSDPISICYATSTVN